MTGPVGLRGILPDFPESVNQKVSSTDDVPELAPEAGKVSIRRGFAVPSEISANEPSEQIAAFIPAASLFYRPMARICGAVKLTKLLKGLQFTLLSGRSVCGGLQPCLDTRVDDKI